MTYSADNDPQEDILDEEIASMTAKRIERQIKRDREIDAIPDPDDEFHRKLEDKAIQEDERQ